MKMKYEFASTLIAGLILASVVCLFVWLISWIASVVQLGFYFVLFIAVTITTLAVAYVD